MMVMVHFFVREIRRKAYLMADSSAVRGVKPLWPSPELLFEVDRSEAPDQWVERAKKRVMDAFDVEFVRVFYPARRDRTKAQVFDMEFEMRTDPGKKGILRLIGVKK